MRNKEIKNTLYAPNTTLEKKHEEKFLENQTPLSFLSKMNKIRGDIHPDFLTQFDKYTSEVSSLLSNNISVVASRVVQEAVYEENFRVETALSKTGKAAESLDSMYSGEILKPSNNRNYRPLDLSKVS